MQNTKQGKVLATSDSGSLAVEFGRAGIVLLINR